MDDPIFDPWGDDAEDALSASPGPPPSVAVPAASSSGPKWRAPVARLPREPAPAPPTGPAAVPRARLAGTAGFLRSMAVPRLQDVTQRLQMARHEASVEDRLDGSPPSVRLTLRPWRGPWTEELHPPQGLLEVTLDAGPDGPVTLRTWLDDEADRPTEEVEVSPSKLSAGWLGSHVVHFIERLLARA